jgi:hypothetical protein
MLVLNCSEVWRVVKAQFSSFMCKSMFYGVSLTVLQSQFLHIGSPIFVISLLKQISSEGFGSRN